MLLLILFLASLGIALPEGYGMNWVNGLKSLDKAGEKRLHRKCACCVPLLSCSCIHMHACVCTCACVCVCVCVCVLFCIVYGKEVAHQKLRDTDENV